MTSKNTLLSTRFGVSALITLSLSLAACSAEVRVLGDQTGTAGRDASGGRGGADDPGSEGGTNSAGSVAVGGYSAAGSAGRNGASCVVKGVIYEDGSIDVPRPDDCNTCTCDNGQLVACTKIECTTTCPAGTKLGTQCLQCGPADQCLAVEHKCLTTCSEQQPCVDLNPCVSGVCKELSGLCG